MVDRSMQGLYPILAMPFDVEGNIDFEDLEREVEFAIDSGVDGLGIALGSEIFKSSNVRHPAIRPDDTNFRQVQNLVESLDLSNVFS